MQDGSQGPVVALARNRTEVVQVPCSRDRVSAHALNSYEIKGRCCANYETQIRVLSGGGTGVGCFLFSSSFLCVLVSFFLFFSSSRFSFLFSSSFLLCVLASYFPSFLLGVLVSFFSFLFAF